LAKANPDRTRGKEAPMDLDEFLGTLPETLEQIRDRNPDCRGEIRGLLAILRQYQASPTNTRLRSQVYDKLLALEAGLEPGTTDQRLVAGILTTLQSGQLIS